MNNPVGEYNLDVFLQGENIDLCLPTADFAEKSTWYSWFNSFKTTRFLEQGIFPNTSEKQVLFYKELISSDNRISLIISDKKQYIGTISLSFINLYKRTADIALLIGEESTSPNADFIALEAMALMTEFGFDNIGLQKIGAGQHEKLMKWQRKLETIGYRLEGYKINGFIKGNEVANSVLIGITKDDYSRIKEKRGKLWDSTFKMDERINSMPAEPFVTALKKFFDVEGNDYYHKIFAL